MSVTRVATINDVTPYTLKATVYTRRVRVREDQFVVGWPTTGIAIKMPSDSAVAIGIAGGLEHVFEREGIWKAGDTIAVIGTQSGSTTLAIIEEGI